MPPLYIEVDVQEGRNSLLPVNKIFKALEAPAAVERIMAPDSLGNERWCAVTGWSSSGPCPALAALVEDSGEGVVTLLYGGDEGIRLKAVDAEESWDLDSPAQWGEPCLLLDRDVKRG